MLSRRKLVAGLGLALGASTTALAEAVHGATARAPAPQPHAGHAALPTAPQAYAPAQPQPVRPAAPVEIDGPSPDEALGRLKHGNAIYARGGASMALPSWTRMSELASGQRPFAVIVGCSDSRAPPELLFDCSIGELFVVRVAGSTVDRVGLGSIVYAVEHLGAPLIIVMGHTKCGAVGAATDVAVKHTHLDSALNDMVLPIIPSVLEAQASSPVDLVDAAIRMNVRRTAERLETAHFVFHERIGQGRLRILPACYDLSTGVVEFMT
jgi:carbonic anhydrase